MIWTGEHVTIKRAGTGAETPAGSNHNARCKEQGIMADSQLTRECESTEEVFKEIAGFPGYEVGTNGTVRSWWLRGTNGARRQRASQPFALKLSKSGGYWTVSLGRKSSRHVHRLVLEAFVGPCPEGMEACHENGIRSDARLVNLRWDTRKGNHADKKRHGTHQSGEKNPSAVFAVDDVVVIKQRLVAGDSCKSIAADYGVDDSTIGAIRNGIHWADVAPELNSQFPPTQLPEINGRSVRQEAMARGLSTRTVYYRLRKGYTLAEALNPESIKGFRRDKAKEILNA
jgi:hypothetical protein